MCGGARRLRRNQDRAAWFLFSVLLLNLVAASSQGGHQEQVHVGERSPPPSPIGGGGGEPEQLSRLGSRPPRCERKCGGCAPCEPVKVRAGAAQGGVRLQCADYEPVGWRCRCGSAVFDP